jgi:hypothetical protein
VPWPLCSPCVGLQWSSARAHPGGGEWTHVLAPKSLLCVGDAEKNTRPHLALHVASGRGCPPFNGKLLRTSPSRLAEDLAACQGLEDCRYRWHTQGVGSVWWREWVGRMETGPVDPQASDKSLELESWPWLSLAKPLRDSSKDEELSVGEEWLYLRLKSGKWTYLGQRSGRIWCWRDSYHFLNMGLHFSVSLLVMSLLHPVI